MISQDAVVVGIGGAVLAGVCTLVASVLSKRMSSVSEDQNNLNDSFRLFMESQEQKYDEMERKHADCEVKVGTLQMIIIKLIRALREKGIPLPVFSFQEQMLLLENKSFVNLEELNGTTGATLHVPPAE